MNVVPVNRGRIKGKDENNYGTMFEKGENFDWNIKTLGWKPSCDCGTEETGKGVVLDVFAGSFTTPDIAIKSGRYGIGVELSAEYIVLGRKRMMNSLLQRQLL